MGGSGGSIFKGDIQKLTKNIRDLEKKSQDQEYEIEVNEFLAQELSDYNNRDIDAINNILNKFKSDMEDYIDGSIDLLYGGSIAKHTYIDGLSDVDMLVILNKSELIDKSPKEIRKFFAEVLSDRYGKKNVIVGNLAVTLITDDHTVQLLPALKQGDLLKISNLEGNRWSTINPKAFTDLLTAVNKKNGNKVVPAIKLIKSINSNLPEQQRLNNYHIEALSVEIFKNYAGPLDNKSMISEFFDKAKGIVKTPIRDKTGQSFYIDDYLEDTNSNVRRIVSMALERISRKISNADGMQSIEHWKKII